MNVATTRRDENILETLTLKIRLATLEQISKRWWATSLRPKQATRARLRKLEDAGWLLRKRVNIHPLLSLHEPLQAWQPGNATPAFGKLAHRLRSRWKEPMQLTTVYVATKRAAHVFGGFGGGFKHRNQLTHDVHVSAIYFMLLHTEKNIEQRWSGEELLELGTEEKRPDAMLFDSNGIPTEVIEFGGRYDARRIAAFHSFCQLRRIGYRLW